MEMDPVLLLARVDLLDKLVELVGGVIAPKLMDRSS